MRGIRNMWSKPNDLFSNPRQTRKKAPSGLCHLAVVNISGLFIPTYATERQFCWQLDTSWKRILLLRNYLQQIGLWGRLGALS